MMKTFEITNLSVEQIDDLYDLICEYIYDHNFDEEYILSGDRELLELDDTAMEVRDSENLHIEVGTLDDNIVVANHKMGFLYTSPLVHDQDYAALQEHIEHTVHQIQ